MSEEEDDTDRLISEASAQAIEISIDLMTVIAIHSGRTGLSVMAITQAIGVLITASSKLLSHSVGKDVADFKAMVDTAAELCEKMPDYVDTIGMAAFENASKVRKAQAH
jgi:flagellar motor component MotA